MKISKINLLFIATLLFMALPLLITGNVGAAVGPTYLSDGAVQNNSGGWNLPSHGTCLGGTLSAPVTVPNVNVSQCYLQTDSSVAAATQTQCTAAGFTWNTRVTPNVCSNTWTWTYAYSGNDQCLRCHNTGYMQTTHGAGALVAAKESYLKTGHKNMLRKVQPAGVSDPADVLSTDPAPGFYTAGYPWAGPDANGNLAVYSGDGTNTYNFANGSITLANGTVANLYWIYGDWIAPAPTSFYGTDAYSQNRTTFAGNNGYSCANCHSTGFQDNSNPGIQSLGTATGSVTPLEPLASFPGLSPVTAASPRWDRYGIQCSRCHYSTYPAVGNLSTCKSITNQTFCTANGGTWNATTNTCSTISGLDSTTCTTNGGTYTAGNPYSAATYSTYGPQLRATGTHNNNVNSLTEGWNVTNLCYGCHQSTSGIAGANDPYDGTTKNPTTIPVGVSHGAAYGRDFNGHVLGNSFLNSPHAQFTGTFVTNPVGETDLYNSNQSQYASVFSGAACNSNATADCNWDSGAPENQGSCTTCHDVHQSLVVANNVPIRRECQDCHQGSQASDGSGGQAPLVSEINHPTGNGTPFDNTKYDNACVVCHMATQAEANGDQNSMPVHVWRINTNPSYNTFPTMAQFYGGSCSVHAGALSTNNAFVKVYASDTSSANCTANSGIWTATTPSRMATESPDGDYANAVWVDLDLACGQCHGGSSTSTHNGAPYIAKADLAQYAAVMHGVAAGTVPPTVSSAITAAGGTFATNVVITLKDASTDPATAQGSLVVSIDWGDGAVSNGMGGGSFTHTYANAGTFSIVETVTNAAGLSTSQYTQELISAAAATTSITGAVYNDFGSDTVPAVGVKVKLKNAAGMIKQVVTTDASGNYAFTNITSPTAQTYTIVAKNVGTQFSYTSATIASGTALPATANLNLNAATIRVSGGTLYPYAKVIITNGTQTIKKWTSTIVPIGTNNDYFTKFKNLSATAPWTITATTTVTGTTQVLNCTVTPGSIDLTAATLDFSGETPTVSATISNCQ
jgi:hypothetical protein